MAEVLDFETWKVRYGWNTVQYHDGVKNGTPEFNAKMREQYAFYVNMKYSVEQETEQKISQYAQEQINQGKTEVPAELVGGQSGVTWQDVIRDLQYSQRLREGSIADYTSGATTNRVVAESQNIVDTARLRINAGEIFVPSSMVSGRNDVKWSDVLTYYSSRVQNKGYDTFTQGSDLLTGVTTSKINNVVSKIETKPVSFAQFNQSVFDAPNVVYSNNGVVGLNKGTLAGLPSDEVNKLRNVPSQASQSLSMLPVFTTKENLIVPVQESVQKWSLSGPLRDVYNAYSNKIPEGPFGNYLKFEAERALVNIETGESIASNAAKIAYRFIQDPIREVLMLPSDITNLPNIVAYPFTGESLYEPWYTLPSIFPTTGFPGIIGSSIKKVGGVVNTWMPRSALDPTNNMGLFERAVRVPVEIIGTALVLSKTPGLKQLTGIDDAFYRAIFNKARMVIDVNFFGAKVATKTGINTWELETDVGKMQLVNSNFDSITKQNLIKDYAGTSRTLIRTSQAEFGWKNVDGTEIVKIQPGSDFGPVTGWRSIIESEHLFWSPNRGYLGYSGLKLGELDLFEDAPTKFVAFKPTPEITIIPNSGPIIYKAPSVSDVSKASSGSETGLPVMRKYATKLYTQPNKAYIPVENVLGTYKGSKFSISPELQVVTPAKFTGKYTGFEYPETVLTRIDKQTVYIEGNRLTLSIAKLLNSADDVPVKKVSGMDFELNLKRVKTIYAGDYSGVKKYVTPFDLAEIFSEIKQNKSFDYNNKSVASNFSLPKIRKTVSSIPKKTSSSLNFESPIFSLPKTQSSNINLFSSPAVRLSSGPLPELPSPGPGSSQPPPPPDIIPPKETGSINRNLPRSKSRSLEDAWNVYVKNDATKKAKYVKVNNEPLNKRSATMLGINFVDNTVSANFKIAPTKGKPNNLPNLYENKNKVRDYKIVKGKKVPLVNTYIENSKYRIDTKGEKQGITAKGLKALRNKKAANIIVQNKPVIKKQNILTGLNLNFNKIFNGGGKKK